MKGASYRILGAVLACWLATSGPAHSLSPGIAKQLGHSLADAVERVMPSVVVIRTESTVYHAARDQFWGTLYQIPERLAGQGSGVIISDEGHVLTSLHVIDRAQEIEVVLHDGTKLAADVVGKDMHSDLAVLRISEPAGRTFTAIEWGDSDALRVGEFVIAVGSPFSLSSSVTAGIVSQKGRSVGLLPYEDFIQTDAPINPGNSGGPLVDADGRMVGINAVIQTAGLARGSVGIGFAVPSSLALHVAKSLIEHGVVKRPWIGVHLADPDGPAAGPRPPGARGVFVADVVPDTPAAGGGMLRGDLIRAVDGNPVDDVRAVQKAILQRAIGDKVEISVRRGLEDVTLTVITEDMPAPGR